MKKMKIVSLILAIAMVVGMCSMFAGCGKKEEATTFKIGMSGPLTGGASVYGIAVKNSAEMAIEEINAAGGLDGVKFELIATDDQHDPSKVQTNFDTMMDKGVHVTLGTVTTKPGMEFKSLSQEENLFYLTPSASGDDIVGNGNGFQMCFADGDQGKVAAEYVKSLGLTKIGVFFKNDDPYSTGILENFKANAEGIELVEAEFSDANATDFATQIDKLKECTFIFMPIYYQPAAIFMKQAKDTIAADAIYYGCDGFDGLEGELGADFTSIPQEISMLSHFNAKATDGKANEFITKYTDKFGTDTLNQFGASAYDSVYAIFGAMKELADEGKEITPEIEAAELSTLLQGKFTGGYSFADGATGQNITWESNGKVKKGATKYTLKEAN